MLQHYVPRFYLEAFADPTRPTNIWVYAKGAAAPQSWGIRGTAAETDYYSVVNADGTRDDFFENTLSRVEGLAAPILHRWQANPDAIVTAEEIERLSLFMALLYARVPRTRADAEATIDRLTKRAVKDVFRSRTEVARFLAENPDLTVGGEEAYEISQNPGQGIRLQVTKQSLTDGLTRVALEILTHLLAMNVGLVIAPESMDFVTSDSPLSVCAALPDGRVEVGAGIGLPTAEVVLPLSPRRALHLARAPLPRRRRASVSHARAFNRRIAVQAERLVFASRFAKRTVNLVADVSWTLARDRTRLLPVLASDLGLRVPPRGDWFVG